MGRKLARKEPVTRENGALIHADAGDWFEQRAYWFDAGGLMVLPWRRNHLDEWEADNEASTFYEPEAVARLRGVLVAAQPQGRGEGRR